MKRAKKDKDQRPGSIGTRGSNSVDVKMRPPVSGEEKAKRRAPALLTLKSRACRPQSRVSGSQDRGIEIKTGLRCRKNWREKPHASNCAYQL